MMSNSIKTFQLDKNSKIDLYNNFKSFNPNLTSSIVFSQLKKYISKHNRQSFNILDLGCGNGVIGISLAKIFPSHNYFFSDLNSESIALLKKNIRHHKISNFSIKEGSLLLPWINEINDFDIIINDVSGISEKIAKYSSWFGNNIPCSTGDDGTSLFKETINFIKEHHNKKKPLKIFSAVLSLSNIFEIEKFLNKNKINYEYVYVKEWPIPNNFENEFYITLRDLKQSNIISYKEISGFLICETRVMKIEF